MIYHAIFALLVAAAHARAHASDGGVPMLFLRDSDLLEHHRRQIPSFKQPVTNDVRIRKRNIGNDWSVILPRSGRGPPHKQELGNARPAQRQGEASSSSDQTRSPKPKSFSDLVSFFEGNQGTAPTLGPGRKKANVPKPSAPLNVGSSRRQANIQERPRSPIAKESGRADGLPGNQLASHLEPLKIGSPERKRLMSGASTASDKSAQTPLQPAHQMPRYESPEGTRKTSGTISAGPDAADKMKQPHLFSTQVLPTFGSPDKNPNHNSGGLGTTKVQKEGHLATQALEPFMHPDENMNTSAGSNMNENRQHGSSSSNQAPDPFRTPDRKTKTGTWTGGSDKLWGDTPPNRWSPYQSPAQEKLPEDPSRSRSLNRRASDDVSNFRI